MVREALRADEDTADLLIPEALSAASELGVDNEHTFNTLLAAVGAADEGALVAALGGVGPFTAGPPPLAFGFYRGGAG